MRGWGWGWGWVKMGAARIRAWASARASVRVGAAASCGGTPKAEQRSVWSSQLSQRCCGRVPQPPSTTASPPPSMTTASKLHPRSRSSLSASVASGSRLAITAWVATVTRYVRHTEAVCTVYMVVSPGASCPKPSVRTARRRLLHVAPRTVRRLRDVCVSTE